MNSRTFRNRLEPILWSIKRNWIARREHLPLNQKLFHWKEVPVKRTDIINKLIADRNYLSYLEVGCQNDINFAAVPVPKKLGVDPVAGGTHRMTSDAFFKNNTEKFDLVFIDGLHTYEQVYRDVMNSIRDLNIGGTIVLHDMLPASWEQEHMPRINRASNGTCWKISYQLKEVFGDSFGIVLADEGVGVIFKDSNMAYPPLSDEDFAATDRKTYQDFLNDYHTFNLVRPEHLDTFIHTRKFS